MAINQDAEVLYSAQSERCLPLFSLRIQQKRQINTKTAVKRRVCNKCKLKALVTQRGMKNPITLVNKLTFVRIMPLCPLAYFLGRACTLQGLNKPLTTAVIALKSNVH